MLREVIALPMSSKIWIYQSTKEFDYDDIDVIRHILYDFADTWESHGIPIQGYANLFHKRFIVFMADETNHGVSGCSTDKSVHLVEELSTKMNADFFDRMHFCYMDDKEEIQCLHKDKFIAAYQNGTINDETLVFDHLVKTKGEFLTHWIKPLKESWHARFVSN